MKMSRKTMAAACVAAMLSVPAFADYPNDVAEKFGRGLANGALGWVEFFKNSYNEPAQKGMLYAPVGLMKGVAHAVGRTMAGALEIASFPIPSDSLVHPAYVWEDAGTETTYGLK